MPAPPCAERVRRLPPPSILLLQKQAVKRVPPFLNPIVRSATSESRPARVSHSPRPRNPRRSGDGLGQDRAMSAPTVRDDVLAGARAVAPMLVGVVPFGLVAGATPVTHGLGGAVA